MPKIIRVDIDGTICETTRMNYEAATPMQDRIDAVNKMYDEGNVIIYWTSRGVLTKQDWYAKTKAQLDGWGCKYHELDTTKPLFDAFYDDRAFNAVELYSDAESYLDYISKMAIINAIDL